MDRNLLILNDHKLVDLYAEFQKIRRALGAIYPNAHYDDFVDRDAYLAIAMPAVITASEHVLSSTNTLNRFCYDLHGITAWGKIFETLSEDERIIATFEFVSLIVDHCLSAPYSIKQMLMKSIYNITCQTNWCTLIEWNGNLVKRDRELKFKDVCEIAECFTSWPTVCDALTILSSREFVDATDDYRNRLNHEFPRRIEWGNSMTIKRSINPSSYTLYDMPPLSIADLIPLVAEQYKTALDCHSAYIELIKEQSKLWPRPA